MLFGAVVVLTVLTQAFAFEAIRFLEGYWGTWRALERLAERRTRQMEARACRLRRRLRDEIRRALDAAVKSIKKKQRRARRGERPSETIDWSPEQLAYLKAKVGKRKFVPEVSDDDRVLAQRIKWEAYAPAESMRRQRNLEKRLRDFPLPGRCLPTRLGTILRKYEDDTKYEPVETFVLYLYDKLPPALKTQHDDHRNRLDLYCSMVFVMLLVTVVSVARFIVDHRGWALSAVLVGALSVWVVYRAALASARLYGIVLVTIAEAFPQEKQSGTCDA